MVVWDNVCCPCHCFGLVVVVSELIGARKQCCLLHTVLTSHHSQACVVCYRLYRLDTTPKLAPTPRVVVALVPRSVTNSLLSWAFNYLVCEWLPTSCTNLRLRDWLELPLPRFVIGFLTLTASMDGLSRSSPCTVACCFLTASLWCARSTAFSNVSSGSSCIRSESQLFSILSTVWSNTISSCSATYPQCLDRQ